MASKGSSPSAAAAIKAWTRSVNSPTVLGRAALGSTAAGPAGTWWTARPGSTSTTGGRSGAQARVNTSQVTPVRARAAASSRT